MDWLDISLIDWLGKNWGSVVSPLGLAATIIGLAIVFNQAREAKKSAEASKLAAQAAEQAITKVSITYFINSKLSAAELT